MSRGVYTTRSMTRLGSTQAAPPPTLATDLSGALGSIECADVKFLAGGRPIYAHRAVLSCRSEYFSAMFRFRCDSSGMIRTTLVDKVCAVTWRQLVSSIEQFNGRYEGGRDWTNLSPISEEEDIKATLRRNETNHPLK